MKGFSVVKHRVPGLKAHSLLRRPTGNLVFPSHFCGMPALGPWGQREMKDLTCQKSTMKKMKGTEEALEGGDNQEPRAPGSQMLPLGYATQLGARKGLVAPKGGPEALES